MVDDLMDPQTLSHAVTLGVGFQEAKGANIPIKHMLSRTVPFQARITINKEGRRFSSFEHYTHDDHFQ